MGTIRIIATYPRDNLWTVTNYEKVTTLLSVAKTQYTFYELYINTVPVWCLLENCTRLFMRTVRIIEGENQGRSRGDTSFGG